VANMAHMIEDMMFRGGATADFTEVHELTKKIAELFTGAKQARITTPQGTDITFGLESRTGMALSGTKIGAGTFLSIPCGEMAISPLEGTTEGIICDPYFIDSIGYVKDPVKVFIFSLIKERWKILLGVKRQNN